MTEKVYFFIKKCKYEAKKVLVKENITPKKNKRNEEIFNVIHCDSVTLRVGGPINSQDTCITSSAL